MESKSSEVKGRTVAQKIKNTYIDELILGICTHIGSKRDIVVEKLREILKSSYEYEVEVIKLSDFITQHSEIEYKEVSGKTNGYFVLKK